MRRIEKLFVWLGFLLCCKLAFAGANDVQMTQRNAADNGTVQRMLASPTDGLDRIFFFSGTALMPGYLAIGSGLQSNSGVLSAVNSNWNATIGQSGFIQNKPTISMVGISGQYADLSGSPTLSLVATSGNYSDLSGRPTLAAVATSGSYSDLSGRPSLSAVATSGQYSDLLSKPVLAPVATSGAYSSLTGLPMLSTVAGTGSYSDLVNIPSTFSPAAHTQAWSTITSTPATLSGYGIMDGVSNSSLASTLTSFPTNTQLASQLASYATTASLSAYATGAQLTSGLAAKFNAPTGTTAQYLRGDGSLATLPVQDPFTVGSPVSRSVSLATAYQCSDTTKPCTATITVTCPLTLSLLVGATCAGEVRIGASNTVATGGGTNIAPIQRGASGVIGLSTNNNETKTIRIPSGWYFAVRQTTGTGMAIVSAFDQSEG